MNKTHSKQPEDLSWLYIDTKGDLYLDSVTIEPNTNTKIIVMNRIIGFTKNDKGVTCYLRDLSKRKDDN